MKQFLSAAGRLGRRGFLWNTFLIAAGWTAVLGFAWVADLASRPWSSGAGLGDTVIVLDFLCAGLFLMQCAKRLHDLGRSGWGCLWFAIPPAGVYLLAVLFSHEGLPYLADASESEFENGRRPIAADQILSSR